MYKTAHLSIMTLAFVLFGFSTIGQTTDLFISEYAEGSSNNKYIEIYNGTGADVDLTDYVLRYAFNANTWSVTESDLTGILANGAVYIVAHSSADASILAAANMTFSAGWFNGNDAVGLFSSSSLIDIIGIPSDNPSTGWNVAGTTNATANHTLVRKSTICSPNTNWAASAGTSVADSEWIVLSEDDWTNLGSHTASCGGSASVPVSNAPIYALFLILLVPSLFFIIKK